MELCVDRPHGSLGLVKERIDGSLSQECIAIHICVCLFCAVRACLSVLLPAVTALITALLAERFCLARE